MPAFDLVAAMSADDWEPRVAWMADNCEEHAHDHRYRDPDPTDDATGWDLPHAAFGDYSGGTLERANSRSFKELFGDAVELQRGGYGSVTTWITTTSVKDMAAEQFEELKEVIENLSDYPLINENTLSDVENELEDEAWEDWIMADFLKELKKHFAEELEAHVAEFPQHEDIVERLDEEAWSIFRETEPEFVHEQGGNVHVSLDRCLGRLDFGSVLQIIYPEDQRQLKFDLRTEGLVDSLLETDGPHSYSSTQINLPEGLAAHLVEWCAANISEEDLFVDADGGLGRETEMHTTVKYGLTAVEPSRELLAILATTESFEVKLGSVSLFTTNADYDVVKLTVDSPGLRELNRQVSAACPNEDKFPTYTPHVTIFYARKGRGDRFVGQSVFEDTGKFGRDVELGVFQAGGLVFSSKSREKLYLPFGQRKEVSDDS